MKCPPCLLLLAVLALSGAAAEAAPPVYVSRLVYCAPELCGGFAQNRATMKAQSAAVSVAADGTVAVRIVALRDRSSGQILAHKELHVFYGTLEDRVDGTRYIGRVTTDGLGHVDDTVTMPTGQPYRFPEGTRQVENFVVNDPGINSQFISGFRVLER